MKKIAILTSMTSLQESICKYVYDGSMRGMLSGDWHDCQVQVFLIKEAGKVNLTLAVDKVISSYKPDAIIGAGTAKSLTHGLLPGNIIVGSHFRYFDVCLGNDFGRYPNEPPFYFSDDMIVSKMIDAGLCVRQGLVVSGDSIIDDRVSAKKISNHFSKARALDNESAVMAQVCHASNIPFVSVRVIDDTPVMEEKAKMMYPQFRKAPSADALADEIYKVLDKTIESL